MKQTYNNVNSGVQSDVLADDIKSDGELNTNVRLVWVELEKSLLGCEVLMIACLNFPDECGEVNSFPNGHLDAEVCQTSTCNHCFKGFKGPCKVIEFNFDLGCHKRMFTGCIYCDKTLKAGHETFGSYPYEISPGKNIASKQRR